MNNKIKNLILEDGSIFSGYTFGFNSEKEIVGEVVFNTSMTGYQEMLTDPSYRGQILVPTYPMIGNYGISNSDIESSEIQVKGFVVRQYSDRPSHNNSVMNISEYLYHNKIVGIFGVDTRAIVRKIRKTGVMTGIITSTSEIKKVLTNIKNKFSYDEQNLVAEVSTTNAYEEIKQKSYKKIAIIDFGVKHNILRLLQKRSCNLIVFPYDSSSKDILSSSPDGIVLSPGPGDPNNLQNVLKDIKEIINSGIPILGICLGHQLIAKALGAKTFKLPFGHRGGNQPVKDLKNNRVYVTAQNHGYAVEKDNFPEELEITHINLNDDTVSGLKHKTKPIFSIQYHSEASPGPKDSEYIFDEFIKLIENNQGSNNDK
tara:strand:+ start:15123 stop:16235 length:1113 start_codon:yes stop_codon:yes gene_type:complete